ncbi:MAG: C4-dicarboxylate ABC transporter, partial [Burkholderiaceae bacterium]|nr:C4-dicarboxylate ABC transporter [Burkholderiaceae bacterium]
ALFYLRSVAPTVEYLDKVTKKMVKPITTLQIYWGAVPFVLIQIIMVTLVIVFPGIVSSGLDKKAVYDLDKVRREMEAAMPDPAAFIAPNPTAGMLGADPVAGTASAAEGAEPASDSDDPLKALQDSLAEEPKPN